MQHNVLNFDKIKIKNIPRLCTILRGCDRFVISSGNYRLETASILIMYSLLGLKNGFQLDVYNRDKERQDFIMRELNAVNANN